MAERDNGRNAFRKGARTRKIHEDPTYLSFMILFHGQDHSSEAHSPLLNGEAESYLRNVVRTDIGDIYANNLSTFNRVLLKVNREMPWFWQGLKGIETAMTYGEMLEPWRGAEKLAGKLGGCINMNNVVVFSATLIPMQQREFFDE